MSRDLEGPKPVHALGKKPQLPQHIRKRIVSDKSAPDATNDAASSVEPASNQVSPSPSVSSLDIKLLAVNDTSIELNNADQLKATPPALPSRPPLPPRPSVSPQKVSPQPYGAPPPLSQPMFEQHDSPAVSLAASPAVSSSASPAASSASSTPYGAPPPLERNPSTNSIPIYGNPPPVSVNSSTTSLTSSFQNGSASSSIYGVADNSSRASVASKFAPPPGFVPYRGEEPHITVSSSVPVVAAVSQGTCPVRETPPPPPRRSPAAPAAPAPRKSTQTAETTTPSIFAPPPLARGATRSLKETLKRVLDMSQVNSRPPLSEGPGVEDKKTIGDIYMGPQYICIAGNTFSVFDTETFKPLYAPQDGVSASAQVGELVMAGTKTGHVVAFDPLGAVQTRKVTSTHTKPITHVFSDVHGALTLSSEGKLNAWTDISLVEQPQSYRVGPNVKAAAYCAPYLYVGRGRTLQVYDPFHAVGPFLIATLTDPSDKTSSTVGEYSAGYAAEDVAVFGRNDGTLCVIKDLEIAYTINVGISAVTCIDRVGTLFWVGLRNGNILVLEINDESVRLLKRWPAHNGPVTCLSGLETPNLVLSGSTAEIGAWESGLKQDMRAQRLQQERDANASYHDISIQVFSWNVASLPVSQVNQDAIYERLNMPDIFVVGLQEVVDLDNKAKSAKSILGPNDNTDNDSVYTAWKQYARTCLGPDYDCIAAKSMVGLYACVFMKKELIKHTQDVQACVVKTGLGGLHGNKGGVIIRMRVFDSTLCFVNVHLAAGHTSIVQRNRDAETVMKSPIAEVSGYSASTGGDGSRPMDHEYCFFFGDTNYRINTTRELAVNMIKTQSWPQLYHHDQLAGQLSKNPMFVLTGFQEAPISFAPTYKFDRGTDFYDTSDKKRIPSWCDRILYRGTTVQCTSYTTSSAKESDHRPVLGTYNIKLKQYTS